MNPIDLIVIILTVPGAIDSILSIIHFIKDCGKGKKSRPEREPLDVPPPICEKAGEEKANEDTPVQDRQPEH